MTMPESAMNYPINEIFQTLQGEGVFTGVPAVFIRLQGCPVGCSWCDTKHTWEKEESKATTLGDIALKTVDTDTWALADSHELINLMKKQGYTAKHIVITGGEPCIYDLLPLTCELENQGYQCQIETSGTYPIQCSDKTWVTVSPKVGMKGDYRCLRNQLTEQMKSSTLLRVKKTLKSWINCWQNEPKNMRQLLHYSLLAKKA